MAKTYGNWIFLQKVYQESAPRFQIATTNEIEPPFRTAKSLVIRGRECPWCHKSVGVAVGIWRKSRYDEETHLLDSMKGRVSDEISPREFIPPA